MADVPEKLGKSGSVNQEALQDPLLPGRASSAKVRRKMPKTVREGFMVRFGRRKYGRSYFHKRYFVLQPGLLAYYKKRPSDNDIPIRSLSLNANCRVEDRGMKHHHNNVVYVLSIYNKADKSNNIMMASIQLHETISWKEDIERVIEQSPPPQPMNGTTQVYRTETRGVASHERTASSSDSELKGLMLQEDEKLLGFPHAKISGSSGFLADLNSEHNIQFSDPALSDITNDGKHWRLVRCQNGLRIFEEITDDLTGYTRAMKAVGVVEAQCEDIFSLIMGMDETRNEWDSTFHNGMMITEVDGHRAILYHRLQLGWCSWLVWPRDLCYTRYWRRIENGTYVVLFRSAEHPNCPPQPGCVRAHIESGGFRISPLKPRLGCPRARVEHQIQIDLQGWGVNYLPLLQYHCLVQMLNSVAGLREWFSQCENAQLIPQFNRFMTLDKPLTAPNTREKKKPSVKDIHPFTQPQEEAQGDDDESEDEDDGQTVLEETVVKESEVTSLTVSPSEVETGDSLEWPSFSSTVSRDDRGNARNAWSIPHGNNFRVRSKQFSLDRSKILAGESLMQLVAVDWFKYPERMDHLARRKGCAAQVAAEKGLFTVLFNLQVPGSTHYSMVLYFVAKRAIPAGSLLQKFIDSDDGFRNNRLKLIPSVPKGSWIVRQSVGSTPCILGKAVDCNYYRGKKYLEVDVDIGSSTVANGVLGLVFGVVTTLVVDMAFLVQGNSVDELPERLIGTVRISRLELSKAVSPYPEKDSTE